MLNKRTNGRTKNYNHCLPFIKKNQNQKTKGVWVRLNEPFANELEWFIPIQSVQITSH